ncbi:expressed unknown protein [Seminavis robusta]|uniref:Sulfotransferase domain-containing protein n=1 Tax=Seminavis robusta TaxID=568900 RepID=A0A9N8H4K1_9STRA|nr:expressed unknown protein [Seminavis robusta]|eukprot:Sro9_g007640.1 n/a (500) ;mRNA; f:206369-207868
MDYRNLRLAICLGTVAASLLAAVQFCFVSTPTKVLVDKAVSAIKSTPIATATEATLKNGEDGAQLLASYVSQSKSSPILEYIRRQLDDEKENGTASSYQNSYCDLQGGDWCPTGKDAWQQKAPAFMVLGAKKAGTTSLFASLVQHPQIIPAVRKETLFFSPRRFNFTRYLGEDDKKVKVQTIRQDYLSLFRPDPLQRKGEGKVSFDATPGNLLHWDTAARPILCSCPWVKLLVIVRNPTDRLWSNYNFHKEQVTKQEAKNDTNNNFYSFEEYVRNELLLMTRYGLVEKSSPRTQQQEQEQSTTTRLPSLDDAGMAKAWSAYTATCQSAVGRGMYVLNLLGWFKQLRLMGRDPKDALRIVRLEDLKGNDKVASQLLEEVTDWLVFDGGVAASDGVTKQPPKNKKRSFVHFMETYKHSVKKPVLSETTRSMLDEFYAPYNDLLSRLLEDERWSYRRGEQGKQQGEEPVVWPRNLGIRNDGDEGPFYHPTSSGQSTGICSST